MNSDDEEVHSRTYKRRHGVDEIKKSFVSHIETYYFDPALLPSEAFDTWFDNNPSVAEMWSARKNTLFNSYAAKKRIQRKYEETYTSLMFGFFDNMIEHDSNKKILPVIQSKAETLNFPVKYLRHLEERRVPSSIKTTRETYSSDKFDKRLLNIQELDHIVKTAVVIHDYKALKASIEKRARVDETFAKINEVIEDPREVVLYLFSIFYPELLH